MEAFPRHVLRYGRPDPSAGPLIVPAGPVRPSSTARTCATCGSATWSSCSGSTWRSATRPGTPSRPASRTGVVAARRRPFRVRFRGRATGMRTSRSTGTASSRARRTASSATGWTALPGHLHYSKIGFNVHHALEDAVGQAFRAPHGGRRAPGRAATRTSTRSASWTARCRACSSPYSELAIEVARWLRGGRERSRATSSSSRTIATGRTPTSSRMARRWRSASHSTRPTASASARSSPSASTRPGARLAARAQIVVGAMRRQRGGPRERRPGGGLAPAHGCPSSASACRAMSGRSPSAAACCAPCARAPARRPAARPTHGEHLPRSTGPSAMRSAPGYRPRAGGAHERNGRGRARAPSPASRPLGARSRGCSSTRSRRVLRPSCSRRPPPSWPPGPGHARAGQRAGRLRGRHEPELRGHQSRPTRPTRCLRGLSASPSAHRPRGRRLLDRREHRGPRRRSSLARGSRRRSGPPGRCT